MDYLVNSFKALKSMIFGEDVNFLAVMPAMVLIMGALIAIRIAIVILMGC